MLTERTILDAEQRMLNKGCRYVNEKDYDLKRTVSLNELAFSFMVLGIVERNGCLDDKKITVLLNHV